MRKLSLYIMILLYVAAGINHFINTASYRRIMPRWLPAPMALVYASGVCEIVFALLLLLPATRRAGAVAIVCLLVAIFPANIQMALNYSKQHNPLLWLAIARLPLQIVLVWWAYIFTKRESVN